MNESLPTAYHFATGGIFMTAGNRKILIHTSMVPKNNATAEDKIHKDKPGKKSSFHERLMRNSCLACAVLLGILALSNIERPWAQKASGSIEKALTMKIDLDQSIGQMRFVQKIMPESALVFFNLTGETDLKMPVDGNLSHAYSELQPYLMFECSEDLPVYIPKDGIVSAISQLSDGSWGAMIDHGNGVESVISGMKQIEKAAGDQCLQGDIIGVSSCKIYYELREGGNPADPTALLGL